MFTGIITDIGRVGSVRPPSEDRLEDLRVEIETGFDLDEVEIGASICCSGVCLTVVEKIAATQSVGNQFAVEISGESLSKTTLGSWDVGTFVNLERSLKVGDELGGHFVFGHVDGLASVVDVQPDGGSERWVFAAPTELMSFIAAKGSVALDGVSLTVNTVEENRFGINLISHTRTATTFGQRKIGDHINLEIDMLARYVRRSMGDFSR
ncbi:MAG: riboflavin synthase [Pseudomonadota bacterium]